MERVKKGEKYWWIQVNCYDIVLQSRIESGSFEDDSLYKQGNYFASYEDAEVMARKLRIVLKGADVIEMPSEEEIKERLNMIIPTQPVEPWCVEGYCKHIIEFIKSKIVK